MTKFELMEMWVAIKLIDVLTIDLYCGKQEWTRENFQNISNAVNKIKDIVEEEVKLCTF